MSEFQGAFDNKPLYDHATAQDIHACCTFPRRPTKSSYIHRHLHTYQLQYDVALFSGGVAFENRLDFVYFTSYTQHIPFPPIFNVHRENELIGLRVTNIVLVPCEATDFFCRFC